MASWDVFSELDNLRREIDQAFRGFGVARPSDVPFLSPAAARRFPLVNLSEDNDHVYVDALVPGVDPKEIELTVLRNTLTLSGERKPPAEKKGQIVHRSELGFGKFTRTLEMPVEVDPDKVTAEYRDGIMRVTLAKPTMAKPRKIEVRMS